MPVQSEGQDGAGPNKRTIISSSFRSLVTEESARRECETCRETYLIKCVPAALFIRIPGIDSLGIAADAKIQPAQDAAGGNTTCCRPKYASFVYTLYVYCIAQEPLYYPSIVMVIYSQFEAPVRQTCERSFASRE